MLLAGWMIVLAALVLLPPAPVRTLFIVAGTGVEALGLVLLTRWHLPKRGND